MATKKVGGPAMNEMRSRATSASACSGSKRRTRTERMPAAPGTSTPLSSPEMWAIGAGISTASLGPSPWTRAISVAFQLSARCVCSTALGTPVEPEVNSTRATSEGRLGELPAATGGPPRASVRATGVGQGRRCHLDDEGGVDLARGHPRRRRSRSEWRTRRRHGPDAPAGPGEDGCGQAVGHLPGHGLAPPHAAGAQATGHRGDQRLRLCRRQPGLAVDHPPRTARQQRVERRHVPGPAGAAVVAGEARHPGGREVGRHGRAPYPGPH